MLSSRALRVNSKQASILPRKQNAAILPFIRLCSSHEPSPRPNTPLKPDSSQSPPPGDHHALGRSLNLFSTSPYSAGSPLLHADGSHLFLKLQELLRAQHAAFGFREVVSPTIYKRSLWERSGHWDNYGTNMFKVMGHSTASLSKLVQEAAADEPNEEEWGLKPMNCPGHCLLFAAETRSYRDLPIRFADFSPLHRNEVSGSLSGLTRVRRFHQDDGHIFCRPDQIQPEIAASMQMIELVYGAFGLRPYKVLLSTRPEKDYIGTEAEWEEAEKQLHEVLGSRFPDYELNAGDGAFYGPKIDVILQDSSGKEHQTATIQLDFQLPRRFELAYRTGGTAGDSAAGEQASRFVSSSPAGPFETTGSAVPILIHRAILGSLERFLALLIEHYQGHFPFWLAPRQIAILTTVTSAPVLRKASSLARTLGGTSRAHQEELQHPAADRYMVDVFDAPERLHRKVANSLKRGYKVLVTIGQREVDEELLAVDFSTLLKGRDSEKATSVLGKALGFAGGLESGKVTVPQEELPRALRALRDNWL